MNKLSLGINISNEGRENTRAYILWINNSFKTCYFYDAQINFKDLLST